MKEKVDLKRLIHNFSLNCDFNKNGSIAHFHHGYEYVDLGLPSGLKWATMNVGASSETDYGLYFAWGETQGYADASTKAFSWADYKWTEDDGSTMSKYNATDGKTVSDLEDDAAQVACGGSWRMPTATEFQELLNTANCTNAWTTVDGVNGRLFTSKSNGNTLFFPAAGYCYDGSVKYVGGYGGYWSSSLHTSSRQRAYYLGFLSSSAGWDYGGNRFCGFAVRPVVGQ